MNQQPFDIVMPAGGRLEGAVASEAGATVKALVSFGGATILERMIAALRDSGCVGRIVVVGPPELISHAAGRDAAAVLPEGDSAPANLMLGLDWLATRERSERVLIVTADLPLITAGHVRDLVARFPSEDVCVPVIRREDFLARYPGTTDNYVKLSDGAWTLGCAILVRPGAVLRQRAHLEAVFNARKDQLAMARLLGPGFVTRLLMRRVSVSDIAAKCGQLLGCSGAAVLGAPCEFAFDLDDLADYRSLARLLG